jgi:hypothetical protein
MKTFYTVIELALFMLSVFILNTISTSAYASSECKSVGLTRFTLDPKDGSNASVVKKHLTVNSKSGPCARESLAHE